MKKRIKWLDFAKGITIFFVVFGHSLSSIYSSHNIIPLYFNTLMSIIFTFIMPCFFAISGYLYKPINNIHEYISMINKKIISLGIPYIIFSILYVFMQKFGGDEVNNYHRYSDLLSIFSTPISYLWFLYALFFIFVFIGLFNLIGLNNYFIIILCFLLMCISILFPNSLCLGFVYIFSNIIYFYIGHFLNEFIKRAKYIILIKSKLMMICLFLLFIILLINQSSQVIGPATDISTFYNFPTKIISILLLFQFSLTVPHNNIFNYFKKYGKYTLIIYLFHGPTISTFRAISFKIIPITPINTILLSIILTIITWYLSIYICILSKKYKIINFMFYPFKYINKLISH